MEEAVFHRPRGAGAQRMPAAEKTNRRKGKCTQVNRPRQAGLLPHRRHLGLDWGFGSRGQARAAAAAPASGTWRFTAFSSRLFLNGNQRHENEAANNTIRGGGGKGCIVSGAHICDTCTHLPRRWCDSGWMLAGVQRAVS